MAVISAVFEELFYRGFFYGGYKKGNSTRTAIILTSILFGTFHMIAQQSMYAIFAGLILTLIRELTGSMWAGMLLHFVNNGFSVVERIRDDINPLIGKLSITSYYNFDNTVNTVILIR